MAGRGTEGGGGREGSLSLCCDVDEGGKDARDGGGGDSKDAAGDWVGDQDIPMCYSLLNTPLPPGIYIHPHSA